MLRFSVSPGKGFPAMKNHIQNIMNLNLSSPLHITLAVSDDSLYLTKLKKIIDQEYTYPFEIPVTGLDLYHIWKPVILKKTHIIEFLFLHHLTKFLFNVKLKIHSEPI